MCADCWRPAGRLQVQRFSSLSAPPTLDGIPAGCRGGARPRLAGACLTCLAAGASSSCIPPAFDCSFAMLAVPSRVVTSGKDAALDCTSIIAGVAITRWECKRYSPARGVPPPPPEGERGSQVTLVLYHRRRALRLNYAITHILYNSGKRIPELTYENAKICMRFRLTKYSVFCAIQATGIRLAALFT